MINKTLLRTEVGTKSPDHALILDTQSCRTLRLELGRVRDVHCSQFESFFDLTALFLVKQWQ